jgi:hypothetical protein
MNHLNLTNKHMIFLTNIIPALAFSLLILGTTIQAQTSDKSLKETRPGKSNCPMTMKPSETEAYRNSIKDEQINGNGKFQSSSHFSRLWEC